MPEEGKPDFVLEALSLSTEADLSGRIAIFETRLQVDKSDLPAALPYKNELLFHHSSGIRLPPGTRVRLEGFITQQAPKKPHPDEAQRDKKRYYEAQELVKRIKDYDAQLAPVFKALANITGGKADFDGAALTDEKRDEWKALNMECDRLGRARDALKLEHRRIHQNLPDDLAAQPSVRL